MNDNSKMDRGKEHAGPKKMTPRQKQKRNRKATLAAVLCFVAAIAIVGTYTMRDYKTVKKEGELAKAQLEEQKKALEEASQEASGNAQKDSASESGTDGAGTGGKAEKSGSGAGTAGTASKNAATAGNTDGSGNNGNQDGNSQTNGSQQAARTAGSASSANFTSDSKMIWPVSGTVLMNYSMDKTVYFATLDQYKYNPALVISGAEGDQVLCGAPGIIKSIDVTAQTGTTVTVDLGNGYEVLYGQLKRSASKSRRPGRGKKHSRLYRTADKVLQRGRMQRIYGITKRWNTSKPCRLYDKKIKNVYNWGRSKMKFCYVPN